MSTLVHKAKTERSGAGSRSDGEKNDGVAAGAPPAAKF
jgi:hypothetical protein